MKETIIALQETLAHQEQEIVRMSEEIYTQQREIAILRQQVMQLDAKFKEVIEEIPTRTTEQEAPPPHY